MRCFSRKEKNINMMFTNKFIPNSPTLLGETSLSYSRLSTVPTNHPTGRRRSLWNFQKPIQTAIKKSKSKTKNKNNSELEREWLLLGEPSSPRPTISQRDAESTILSDGEPQVIIIIDFALISIFISQYAQKKYFRAFVLSESVFL